MMRNVDLTNRELSRILGKYRQGNLLPSLFKTSYSGNVRVGRNVPKEAEFNKSVLNSNRDMVYTKEWMHRALISRGVLPVSNFTLREYDQILDTVSDLNSVPLNPIELRIYNRIYELYVNNKMSANEVAESLDISIDHVTDILIDNKIPRLNSTQYRLYDPDLLRIFKQIRYYCPDSISLKSDGVSISSNGIYVKLSFKTTKKDSAKYEIMDRSVNYNWAPVIVPEYDDFDITKDYMHWRAKTQFNNRLESRVASLRLIKHCIALADRHPKHPQHVIGEFKRNYTNLATQDNFWKYVEHFFGNDELKYFADRPKQMLHIMTDCHHDISSTNSRAITKILYTKRLKIDCPHVHVLLNVLKNAKIKSIYDPCPGLGTVAIACVILGIKYYYGNIDYIFNRGVRNGLLDFFGDNISEYHDEPVDHCMSTNLPIGWYQFMHGNSNQCSTIVSRSNRQLIMQKYKVITNKLAISKADSLITFKPN